MNSLRSRNAAFCAWSRVYILCQAVLWRQNRALSVWFCFWRPDARRAYNQLIKLYSGLCRPLAVLMLSLISQSMHIQLEIHRLCLSVSFWAFFSTPTDFRMLSETGYCMSKTAGFICRSLSRYDFKYFWVCAVQQVICLLQGNWSANISIVLNYCVYLQLSCFLWAVLSASTESALTMVSHMLVLLIDICSLKVTSYT